MNLANTHRIAAPACLVISLVILASLASGCKSGPEAREDQAPAEVVEQPGEPRAIEMHFVVTDDIAADLNKAAAGELRGAIFRTDDVGAFGPKKGADPVTKLEPRLVDLSAEEPVTWTTPPLAPGEYTFLGFVDLDQNSPDGPDDGDIVTRPATNRFSPSALEGPLKVRFDYIKGSTIFG